MAYTVILTDILYQTVSLYCSFSINLNTAKIVFCMSAVGYANLKHLFLTTFGSV
jgi:hypothetical protein